MKTISSPQQSFKSFQFSAMAFLPGILSVIIPFIVYAPPLSAYPFYPHFTISTETWNQSAILCVAWFVILLCIASLPMRHAKLRVRAWKRETTFCFALVFSMNGFISRYCLLKAHYLGFHQFFVLLSYGNLIGITLSLHLIFSERFPLKTVTPLILANLIIIFSYAYFTHTIGEIIYSFSVIFYMCLQLKLSRKLLLTFLALLMLLTSIIMPLKYIIRDHPTTKHGYYLSVTNGSHNVNAIRLPNRKNYKLVKKIISRHISRVDHLSEFAYILLVTPAPIPYARGSTYKELLITMIPRILWKNKPISTLNVEYAHKYNFIKNKYSTATSWALPVFIEAWVNFGVNGYILSAICIGLLLLCLWNFLLTESGSSGNILLITVIMLPLSASESSTYYMLGNTLKAMTLYFPIEYCIRNIFDKLTASN